jgi:hypothetical protein
MKNMRNEYFLSAPAAKKTPSGVVYAGPCIFHGFLVGTDGINDPVITIYDHASKAEGQEVVPTSTYDSSQMGINGATGMNMFCVNGLYVEITCAGTCEVVLQYNPGYPRYFLGLTSPS